MVQVFCHCSCSQYYLLMAGSCVDQNIIIGVFAGVGGALFLGLVTALICSCKLNANSQMLRDEELRLVDAEFY